MSGSDLHADAAEFPGLLTGSTWSSRQRCGVLSELAPDCAENFQASPRSLATKLSTAARRRWKRLTSLRSRYTGVARQDLRSHPACREKPRHRLACRLYL